MKKILTIKILLIVFFTSSSFSVSTVSPVAPSTASTNAIARCYKKKPRGFGFSNKEKERKMSNLTMIGSVGKFGVKGKTKTEKLYGKILRSLRFQNITRRVERKYGLPKNMVLAMMMQETGGADLLPNGLNDGGLGLVHMQPKVAAQFGLKIYQNNRQMRSKSHGLALKRLIKKHNFDRKKLIRYDDRFHPILNLDAVGRMLHCYKNNPRRDMTKWQTAILRYAGKYNYRKYWRNLQYFRRHLNDPNVIKRVERTFNSRNNRFKIDNYRGNFKEYIRVHQLQNRNYGLDKYR